MDFGIAGRRALVCASSKGLGFACAQALAREGVHVVLNGRNAEALEAAVSALRADPGVAPEVQITAVQADVTQEAGRARVLAAAPALDILVNNAGGPPAGDFRAWDRDTWLRALDANMLTPIELMKAYVDGMIAQGFGRIVNITSAAVKAPIDVLGLSNGARSGLTGFVAGLSRQVAAHGVTINNLLPGPFETDRLQVTLNAWAHNEGITPEAARSRRAAANPSRRFGQPAEFGAYCAFICSRQAAYLTGQNLVLDGGAYPGTF